MSGHVFPIFVGVKHRLTYLWLGLYTILSLGVQVNLHYCSDQLKTIGLWVDVACCHHEEAGGDHDHKHCNESDEDCCSDETFDLGLEDEHLTSRQISNAKDVMTSVLVSSPIVQTYHSSEASLLEAPKTGPPVLVDDSERYALLGQRITYG